MKRYMKHPRLLVGALALMASLTAGGLGSGNAFAGYTACQTDPTVTLSNGQTVTLWTTFGTDISNVSNVNYVLHIPSNLRVVNVQYDQYASQETFTWVADQSGSGYETDTTVTTLPSVGSVPVTTWSSMPYGHNTYSQTGTSGQVLTINWKM